jgi:hypothetical protein
MNDVDLLRREGNIISYEQNICAQRNDTKQIIIVLDLPRTADYEHRKGIAAHHAID